MPAEPLSSTQMWVLIGLAVFVLIYVAIIRPMTRRKSDPLEKPPAFGSLSRQRGVERQMETLVVELSEMTRKISAQLDTRATRLELLIKDADQRIQTLRTLTTAGPPPPVSPTQTAPPEDMPNPRHAEIYDLADQGQDINQIATHLDRPRGEVELILALRGKG